MICSARRFPEQSLDIFLPDDESNSYDCCIDPLELYQRTQSLFVTPLFESKRLHDNTSANISTLLTDVELPHPKHCVIEQGVSDLKTIGESLPLNLMQNGSVCWNDTTFEIKISLMYFENHYFRPISLYQMFSIATINTPSQSILIPATSLLQAIEYRPVHLKKNYRIDKEFQYRTGISKKGLNNTRKVVCFTLDGLELLLKELELSDTTLCLDEHFIKRRQIFIRLLKTQIIPLVQLQNLQTTHLLHLCECRNGKCDITKYQISSNKTI